MTKSKFSPDGLKNPCVTFSRNISLRPPVLHEARFKTFSIVCEVLVDIMSLLISLTDEFCYRDGLALKLALLTG